MKLQAGKAGIIGLFFFWALNGWAQKTPSDKIQWSCLETFHAEDSAASPVRPISGVGAGVHNDRLIFAGGCYFPSAMPWEGGKKVFSDTVHLFRKCSDGNLCLLGKHPLPFKIAYSASASTSRGVVLAGGENESGISSAVLLIQWDEQIKQLIFKKLPDLPLALTAAALTVVDDVLYLAGGESATGTSNKCYSLDLRASAYAWKEETPLPKPSSHALLVAQFDGDQQRLYLIGGRKKNKDSLTTFYNQVWCYNLKAGIWTERAGMVDSTGAPHAVSAATGVASGANFILVFGGDQGKQYNESERLGLAINAATTVREKDSLTREQQKLLSQHPGFSREVLIYSTITNEWVRTNPLPLAFVTSTAVKIGREIYIPFGEIRPGIRTGSIIKGVVEQPTSFSWVDIIVIVVCFLLMTVGRNLLTKKQENTTDYFKGGRRIPKWAAALSIFGAKLSAITFMGIPAKTYATDWSYFFLLMTIVMIMPVVIYFFIPFYRRLDVTSAYEYLEKRFNYAARVFASCFYMLFQLGRMSIVILFPSIALTLVTDINVYFCILTIGIVSLFFTVKGGIEAVIWVEVIQVLILAAGALFCLFYLPWHIGNLGEAFATIRDYDKINLINWKFDMTEPTIWVVIIGGLSMHLFTYGADQTTVQRYLTTPNEKDAVRSLRIGAWLTVPSSLVFFSIGTMMFLFFKKNPSDVNISLTNIDNIFPWYIASQLPAGVSGLLISGIFAATMSSTEASMNSVATLLTTDFYKRMRPGISDRRALSFARWVTLMVGVIITILALFMAYYGVSSLWDRFNYILGLLTGSIGGLFLLGIFTRRASGRGALLGIACSLCVQLFVSQYTDVHLLMYAFTGGLTCFVLGYVFSLLLPPDQKSTEGLTYRSLRKNGEN